MLGCGDGEALGITGLEVVFGHCLSSAFLDELPCGAFILPSVDGGESEGKGIERVGGPQGAWDDVVKVHATVSQVDGLEGVSSIGAGFIEIQGDAGLADE